MPTPRLKLDKMREKRYKTLASGFTDGLFVRVLKLIYRWRGWDCPHQFIVRWFLSIAGRLDHNYSTQRDATSAARWAMDWYTVFYTLLLLGAYFAAYRLHGAQRNSYFWVLCGGALVVAAYRLMEILATIASLHLRVPYRSSAPMRALVLAFVAYVHVVLAFAIFYLIVSDFSKDPFADGCRPTIASDWVTPGYFSLVTITTLGYGDLRPGCWPGKLLVILEVFIGIVFIVVIFQRVIAVTQDRRP